MNFSSFLPRAARVFVFLALLGVGACATYSQIEAAPTRVAKGPIEVTPPAVLWNKVPAMSVPTVNGEVWTASGVPLDTIMFVTDLEDGQSIYKAQRNANTQYPTFKSDMLPNELVELITSSISIQSGATTIDTLSLAPRQFAGAPGFDLIYERTGQDEVTRRGRAAGAIINEKLHLVVYEAARLYYFDQYAAQAEQLIDSASFMGG
jgi:hypothetical protein